MMKKILLLLLVAVLSLSIFACEQSSEFTSESESQSHSESQSESSSSTESQPTTYTVTFEQDGQDDVVITVNEGEGIAQADLPTPAPVTGHTVAWSVTDFSEITANLTVTVIATPNQYVITYVVECNCGHSVAPEADTVTYGTAYTLDVPSNCGCEFLHWALVDNTEFTNGTYSLDDNVTVYAVFSDTSNQY